MVGQTVVDDLSVGVDGGVTPLIYSATGLPSWLTLDEDTGMLTGTPVDEASATSAVITVTDAEGDNQSIVLVIGTISE